MASTTEGSASSKRKLQRLGIWKRKWVSDDVANMTVATLEHILLFLAPFYFTWGALWVAVFLFIMTSLFGINLSYHRNLTHKSFKLPKWLEYFFAYCGLQAAQKDPIFWVRTHRFHHQFCDTQRDPHSPIEGFWFCHIFWLFDNDYLNEKAEGQVSNVMDLEKQAYYMFLQSTYYLHLIGLAMVLYVVGGLPYLAWGMGVRLIYTHHGTFVVNSICHKWGKSPWNTNDTSKNNLFIALLSFGEGWHNNHHAFQFSARLGFEWWQIDFCWYAVKLLECLGLATNVKVVTEKQKREFRSSTYSKNNSGKHE